MDIFAFNTMIHALETIGVFGIVCWAIVSVARTRQGKSIAGEAGPRLTDELQARMERLEQSTEAIALQVERIAEGQRFVTKLMTDNSGAPDKLLRP